MNLFTSNLFTPMMSESLADAPRDFRATRFGRRYGRATPAPAHADPLQLAACVIEAVGEACVRVDYELAA